MNIKSIRKYVAMLESGDSSARINAAQTLAGGDERVVYPLIKALFDESPAVQETAMQSLITIGGEVTAYMTIPVLRKEAAQRNAAIVILREIGSLSVPLLYDLLGDRDDDMKKFAIDLMGEIREGVDAGRLLPMLKDGNANVRAASAKALGLLKSEESIEYLEKALADDEWVSFSALEALGELKSSSAVKSISELLYSDSETLKFASIETLGRIPSRESKEALVNYIKRTDDFTKTIAVKSLINLGIEPDMEYISRDITALLDSDDWDDRLPAIEGIKVLKEKKGLYKMLDIAGSMDSSEPEDEEKIDILFNAILDIADCSSLLVLLRESNLKFRAKAFLVKILGQLNCQEAINDLIGLLRGSFRDIRRGAASALVEIAGTAGEEREPDGDEDNEIALRARKEYLYLQLIEALNDEDGHIREQVVYALGRLKDQRAFDALIRALKKEKYESVVEEFVKSLLAIDSKRFLESMVEFGEKIKGYVAKYSDDPDVILDLSHDESSDVMVIAVSRLGSMMTEESEKRLSEVIGHSDHEVRKVAVMSIEESGRFSKSLLQALNDMDMWVRFYAVRAIAATGGEEYVNVLTPLLHDKEIPVVLNTIDVLFGLGGPEVYDALYSIKEHPDESVREKVEEVLNFL